MSATPPEQFSWPYSHDKACENRSDGEWRTLGPCRCEGRWLLAAFARSERAECSWNRVGGVYETSCGGDLAYEDTLQDCGVVYCQRCGGKVKDITNDE